VETTLLSIAPETSGKVLEVDFQEGELVKAGQVLAHLDDGTLKIQRSIAAANLETAQLALGQLSSPTVIAALQKTIAQDEQAIIDAGQTLDIQKYSGNNADAVQSAEAKLYLARTALNNAQALYDKVKYNNYLDQTVKVSAYQNVYYRLQAYNYALAVYNTLTGVPNPNLVDIRAAVLALAEAKLAEDQTLLGVLNGAAIPANATGAGLVKLELARIKVQSAQASLDILDHQIAKMSITAPVDGVVMTRNVDPGSVVNPGTELLSLARLNDLTITVYIPADAYGKIKVGQTATVTVDSFPDEVFLAAVVYISDRPEYVSAAAQTVSGSSTSVYAIQLELKDASGKLKPGMPADVSFGLK
jgi:HlyD family secretion protein